MHAILKEAQNAAMAIKHEFSILLMKLPKQARLGSFCQHRLEPAALLTSVCLLSCH